MSLFRIYAEPHNDAGVMILKGSTEVLEHAIMAANALMHGRVLPPEYASHDTDAAVPGIVTGVPVWTRYRPGIGLAVMVTEQDSLIEAHAQEAAVAAAMTEV